MAERENKTSLTQDVKDRVKAGARAGTEEARGAAESGARRITTGIGERAAHLAEGVRAMEESLRGKEDWLADAAGEVQESLSRISTAAKEKKLGDLKRDLEGVARHRPALFMGTAFAAGLALARLLRSASRDDEIEDLPEGTSGSYGGGSYPGRSNPGRSYPAATPASPPASPTAPRTPGGTPDGHPAEPR